jgi:hypothetical protein
LQKYAVFSIEPFDTRAALEVAAMSREAIIGGNKRGNSVDPWQKVKFDRQIVGIAKVHGALEIYSDDDGIGAICHRVKIKVIKLADMPLPPEKAQLDFQLEPASDTVEASPGEP